MTSCRIGCSGWVYSDWKHRVYDDLPQREWFSRYAEQFDTVEVNATFYRLPAAETVDRWSGQAPRDFVYSPKVGQYCTHRKKLRDPDQWLDRHLDRVRRLGSHLGPNLLQLPPRWRRNVERLEAFLATAPRDVRWAVEVRDPSWLHDDVFACLARHDAALCIHDLLPEHPWVLTTGWTYVRFHGPHATERPYEDRYGSRRLARIADRFGEWIDRDVAVWAYFNNDWDANAWHDAVWLQDRMAS